MSSETPSVEGSNADLLASKIAQADALITSLTTKVAEIDQIRQSAIVAKTSAEAASEAAVKARDAANVAKSEAEAERAQLGKTISAVSTARQNAEGDREKATQASIAADAARVAAEAARDNAAQANATATASKDATVSEQAKAVQVSADMASSKVAADGERDKASQARTEAEVAKTAAEVALTRANELASAANEAKKAIETEQANVSKIRAEVEVAKNAATTAMEKANDAVNKAVTVRASADAELVKIQKVLALAEAAQASTQNGASRVAQLEKDILNSKSAADGARDSILQSAESATAASSRAEAEAKRAADAHNMSTTVGLAGAFNEKALKNKWRERTWITLLAVSLGAAIWIGTSHYNDLTKLIESKPEPWALAASVVLAIFALGAPVWLAWISTRMVSKNLALTEDYAYKASLAKAYIGFREEAKGLDPILQQRLFAAAITQLDANPVRLLDAAHPGSPLQDLLQQSFMDAVYDNPSLKQLFIDWMNARFNTKKVVDFRPSVPPVERRIATAPAIVASPVSTPGA